MPDTPKLRPYAVAMLFGQYGRVDLGLGIVGALDREHASAYAVLKHIRENDITAPLMGVAIMEITDETVRMMFNSMTGQKAGEIVPMKVVNPLSQQSAADGIAGRYVPDSDDPEPAA